MHFDRNINSEMQIGTNKMQKKKKQSHAFKSYVYLLVAYEMTIFRVSRLSLIVNIYVHRLSTYA